MALSAKELTDLMTLLSEETILGPLSNVAITLEGLTTSFYRQFSKSDNFRIGTVLVLLIQERDLLPSSCQRIAALYLLYDIFHPDPIHLNPFVSIFFELLQPSISDFDWTNSDIISGVRPSLPEKVSH
ncbi:CCR4-NOT transcription complex subunit 11 [Oopsacas minuta]|uniref:CCR4-NOT transcription complex subunit 11 n=1 Tax=Oopsacas minuta TaxID=111878 RepID=A0AAV7JTN0_9METZ|nr:CCR4-NOT transcription complex subunit 11 [Oopsacas minuta]